MGLGNHVSNARCGPTAGLRVSVVPTLRFYCPTQAKSVPRPSGPNAEPFWRDIRRSTIVHRSSTAPGADINFGASPENGVNHPTSVQPGVRRYCSITARPQQSATAGAGAIGAVSVHHRNLRAGQCQYGEVSHFCEISRGSSVWCVTCRGLVWPADRSAGVDSGACAARPPVLPAVRGRCRALTGWRNGHRLSK